MPRTRLHPKRALILAWGVVAACAPAIPQVTPEDARRAGTDLATLTADRAMYVANCSGCHRLFHPGDRTVAEWRQRLPQMSEEASLSPTELAAVERYLMAFARPEGAGARSAP